MIVWRIMKVKNPVKSEEPTIIPTYVKTSLLKPRCMFEEMASTDFPTYWTLKILKKPEKAIEKKLLLENIEFLSTKLF